jgi:hypothetical protein
MSKYIIEGGINFYEELYKSLDETDSNKKEEDESNKKEEDEKKEEDLCLITGMPLTDRSVALECNHKFNYSALYKEICKQKYIFRTYNIDTLTKTEYQKFKDANTDYFIKCPYCRSIQFKLLPYYEDSEYELKYGINSLERTQNDNNYLINPYSGYNHQYTSYGYNFQQGSCCKVIDVKNGLNVFCSSKYSASILEMNKSFCVAHIRGEVKQYKMEKIQKAKLAQKLVKEQQKLEKDEQKLAQKLAKDQQKLVKKNTKMVKLTNEIVTQTIQIGEFNENETEQNNEITGCSAILKSGANKGHYCGATINTNGLCLRHLPKDKDKDKDKI